MTPKSTGSLLSCVSPSPRCELLENLMPIYSDVFCFLAYYLVWPVSPPGHHAGELRLDTLHTLYNHFYQISCQRKLILSCLSDLGEGSVLCGPLKGCFFNQYGKFDLTQIEVVDSGCLRARGKKLKKGHHSAESVVKVALKRGHFNMLRPLEGHPRRHFITFNPPQEHLKGHFSSVFLTKESPPLNISVT